MRLWHSRQLTLAAAIALATGLCAIRAPAQEQKYRERQVLRPEDNEWVDEARSPEEPVGDELDQARALLAQRKPAAAQKLLKAWIKANPDHERALEADFLMGETYFEQGDYWKAVQRYQNAAENSSGDLFQLANGRCVDVGRAFLAGKKRILWGIFRLPAYDDGVEILDKVWQRAPGTRLGEIALKLKADFHFGRGDMQQAQDEYANLAQQYPSGRYIQSAMLRTAEAAEASFPGIKFDDRPLLEADAKYRQFQSAYPVYADQEGVADRLTGIRQQRADKDLDIARWYERTRRSDAAEFYYRQILKDWPDTLAAAEARSRLRALGATPQETEPGATPQREGAGS